MGLLAGSLERYVAATVSPPELARRAGPHWDRRPSRRGHTL